MLPDQRPLENIDSDQGSSKHGNSITIFLEKNTTKDLTITVP